MEFGFQPPRKPQPLFDEQSIRRFQTYFENVKNEQLIAGKFCLVKNRPIGILNLNHQSFGAKQSVVMLYLKDQHTLLQITLHFQHHSIMKKSTFSFHFKLS